MTATSESGLAPGDIPALLRDAYSKLMRSRIRMSHVHAIRASSIGNECNRFLYYEQTASEKRVAHGESLQAIFDLGNEVERYVVRLIEDMGFGVENRNHSYHDRAHNLTGHLDGRLRIAGRRGTIPLEIKGLNPYTSDTIETLADIRDSRQAWVRKYYGQLQSYLHMGEDPLGLFVLFNKSTAHLSFVECPIDRPYIEQLLARADIVKASVVSGVAPDRNRSDGCVRCPFVHVCVPDIEFGKGAEVLDAPELIEAIRRREAAREGKREFDAADKTVKSLLPDTAATLLVGPYELTGKQITRSGHTVAAGSFVKWSLNTVGPVPAERQLNPNSPKPVDDESF